MLILGVTGGSGSGKTTLLHEAEAMGALVLDCDAIYHELLAASAPMLAEIAARFPGSVTDGTLDRKRLGRQVFADPAALHELSTITHRYVRREVLARIAASTAPFALIDAIALIESGLSDLCAATICLTAPEAVRVTRLVAREGISADYARARIRAQQPDSFYRDRCTHTLVNDYPTAEAFAQAARSLLQTIKEQWI